MKRKVPKRPATCPCGSGADYDECCGAFIDGRAQPRTAEQLMRSRYTAYARGNTEWLKATWHPATHRGDLDVGQPVKWVRLEIVATKAGGPDDDRGEVEFIAHYKIQGRAHRLHERSCFQRRDGRWLYVDGDLSPVTSCDDRD